MAIAPTGAIYKSLIFDGEDSRDYGVYITGQAVFNAPEREVEMITIPARNGLFALDQGRFENIEVTYPAGIFADTEADFAQAISDFRNFLCSRKGYCRLTDDYNPDEYRMAIYKEGLDVKLSELKAGEFNITFNCKPQRFLTSGDTAVTVASGGTITNPTLFESSPLLEVTGYGNINLGGKTVTVNNSVLGEIRVSSAPVGTSSMSFNQYYGNLNTGDSIYRKDSSGPRAQVTISSSSNVSVTVGTVSNCTANAQIISATRSAVRIYPTQPQFVKGTASSITSTATISLTVGSSSYTVTITVTTAYQPSPAQISMNVSASGIPSSASYTTGYYWVDFYGNSTKTLLPTPMYIDLDIGEAYGYVNNQLTSFNNIVSMPAELPVLASGSNSITYGNTVTNLKIVPRWWRI